MTPVAATELPQGFKGPVAQRARARARASVRRAVCEHALSPGSRHYAESGRRLVQTPPGRGVTGFSGDFEIFRFFSVTSVFRVSLRGKNGIRVSLKKSGISRESEGEKWNFAWV